ncbi:MAG: acyl-CoA thioesterase [Hyphomonadaceae bacterium]
MKPGPERLLLDAYPRRYTLETRFSDVDRNEHLNNVAIASFYEDARVRAQAEIYGPEKYTEGQRVVAANVAIAYLEEGYYPDAVTVTCGVGSIGRTSYTIAQALFQNGKCIGVADTVIVFCNAAGPTPLPPTLRAELEKFLLTA